MKKIIAIIITIVVLSIVGYYFYYSQVEVIIDRYLVKYQPPTEQIDSDLNKTYSKPLTSLTEISFKSDEEALDKTFDDESKFKERLLTDFKAFCDSADTSDEGVMKFNAYKMLLNEQWYIISISHTRSYDPQKLIRYVTLKGLTSDNVKSYAIDHDLDVRVYNISE